jgi:hypothetical protein
VLDNNINHVNLYKFQVQKTLNYYSVLENNIINHILKPNFTFYSVFFLCFLLQLHAHTSYIAKTLCEEIYERCG